MMQNRTPKTKISFLPFQPCLPGKATQFLSLILNPFSWPLTIAYTYNYLKLKKLTKDNDQEWKKLRDRSYKILIATYTTHIVFFLAANAAAAYYLAAIKIKAERNISIASTALYIVSLTLFAVLFALSKEHQPKNRMQAAENTTNSTKNQEKHNLKSAAHILMNLSLISTGPLVLANALIVNPAFAIYLVYKQHCTKHINKNNQSNTNSNNPALPLSTLEDEVNFFIAEHNINLDPAAKSNQDFVNILKQITLLKNKNTNITIKNLNDLFKGAKTRYFTETQKLSQPQAEHMSEKNAKICCLF